MSLTALCRGALITLFILLAGPVRAERVDGLFEADVPVEAQDDASRRAAVRSGLETVFVKLTGSRRALENPALVASLSDADRYLLQFSYKSAEALPARDGTRPRALLHVSFQPAAVEDLLRRAGEPILPATRPVTLLWLVIDDGVERRMLAREAEPDIVQWLLYAATQRGMPLGFPLLDLEDTLTVSTDQLWAMDTTAVTEASGRYGADSVLLGRMARLSTGEWIGEWRHLLVDQSLYLDARAPDVAGLSEQLVDRLAEAIAERYGIVPSLESAVGVSVTVSGIDSVSAFRQVSDLLARLASVRDLRVRRLEGDRVAFELFTDSEPAGLAQEITLLPQLRPAAAEDAFSYRWAGN